MLVRIAFPLHATRMGTEVAILVGVPPDVETRSPFESDNEDKTRLEEALFEEQMYCPLLLRSFGGARASVARLTAPGLVLVLTLTAGEEKAGGGAASLSIATGRAIMVAPTTVEVLGWPLLAMAKATEVGLVQLPTVANPRAPLLMWKLAPDVPAVATELVSLRHGLPLVFICIQLPTPTRMARCVPITTLGVPGCSTGGNMLHVGIRTKVADAIRRAAPAIAHGMVSVREAKLMAMTADVSFLLISVRLAVEGRTVILSLSVAFEGPVTYGEMLMLMDRPLTALVVGMW